MMHGTTNIKLFKNYRYFKQCV